MDCDRFSTWFKDAAAQSLRQVPEDMAEHWRNCPKCQGLLEQELFWRHFFAATPQIEPPQTFKADVLRRIRTREEGRETFSIGLFQLGIKLIPALALLLIIFAGVASWKGVIYTPPKPIVVAFINFSGAGPDEFRGGVIDIDNGGILR